MYFSNHIVGHGYSNGWETLFAPVLLATCNWLLHTKPIGNWHSAEDLNNTTTSEWRISTR